MTECSEITDGLGNRRGDAGSLGRQLLERAEVSADVLLATVQAHAFAVSRMPATQVEGDVRIADADLEVSIVEQRGRTSQAGRGQGGDLGRPGNGRPRRSACWKNSRTSSVVVGCSQVVTAAG